MGLSVKGRRVCVGVQGRSVSGGLNLGQAGRWKLWGVLRLCLGLTERRDRGSTPRLHPLPFLRPAHHRHGLRVLRSCSSLLGLLLLRLRRSSSSLLLLLLLLLLLVVLREGHRVWLLCPLVSLHACGCVLRLLLFLLPLDGLLLLPVGVLLLESFPAPQVGAVVEHVPGLRVQRPVRPLTRLLVVTGYLDETFVETQVVANGVLPPLLVFPIVRKPLHDELVDAVQSDALLGVVLDGHGNESDVRVGRLHHVLGRGVLLCGVAIGMVAAHSTVPVITVGIGSHGGHLLQRRRRVGGGRMTVVRLLVPEQSVHFDGVS
ncbi:hypothetical protein E2C01_021584 [Portunus trituberculatus]|uniref:Uncharacterized protein n=1 Tax=Portunus trituberculatus TaxID=210409 RepID=A0A5B7E336_PORTR|nr:hypothetical protein [Portunus trituberculatus]